jgi:hypothetical protein
VLGSSVFAGTLNQTGAIEVRVERRQGNHLRARIVEAVEKAERSRAPIQKTADRLAGYLVYFALGAALLTFLITHNARSTISAIIVAGACGSPLERHWPFSARWVALRGREQSLKDGLYLSCWHESIRCCWTRPAHLP